MSHIIPIMRATVVSLGLVLAFLASPACAAQDAGQEDFLQLRVKQPGGETLLVLPRSLVRDMSRTPTGATFSVGSLGGKDVRISVDRMLRSLCDVPTVTPAEVHLLTRASDAGAVFFFAKALKKPAAPRSPNPLLLDVDLTRKGTDGGRTKLALPLMGAAAAASLLSSAMGLQLGSDLQPLLENLMQCTRRLGSGPVATVVAPDAEAVLTAR